MEYSLNLENEFGSNFFYSIADAAVLLGINPNHLLQMAAQGKLEALVLLQLTNLSGRIVKTSSDGVEDLYLTVSPIRSQVSEKSEVSRQQDSYHGFVHLAVDDAKSILVRGRIEQRKFREIYNKVGLPDGPLGRNRRIFSSVIHKNILQFSIERLSLCGSPITGSQFRQRKIYLERPTTIMRNHIYFALTELMHLVRSEYLNGNTLSLASSQYKELLKEVSHKSEGRRRTSLLKFQRKSYHSQKLLDLIQVSNFFWSTIYFEDEDFPSVGQLDNEIAEYLFRNYDFDMDLAKSASKLIVPEYAKKKPNVKHQLSNFGLATPRFEVLIQANEYFYSKTASEKNVDFVNRRQIEAWFIRNHEFPFYLAIAAAKIIEPSQEDIDDFIDAGN